MLDWRNSADRYGAIARILHWLMAVLLVAQLVLGFAVWEFLERGTPLRQFLAGIHISVGVTLLALVMVRLAWRRLDPPPPPAADQTRALVLAARVGHGSLYVLLFALPLTGWLVLSTNGAGPSWFGLFRLPPIAGESERWHEILEVTHKTLAWALIVVASSHAVAAVWHHFGRRDGVLLRMLGRPQDSRGQAANR
jgi:cytochrome b561